MRIGKKPPRFKKQEHRQKTDKFYLSQKWRAVRYEVGERDQWLCQECLKNNIVKEGRHCDHIVPRRMGGADYDLDNLQMLCKKCHDSKSSKERWQ